MVRERVEILSFGGVGTPDANLANGMQTVPRKRRPRARGEIFITSESKIYLTDPGSPELIKSTEETCDPIYENTSANGSVTGAADDNQRPEIYENLRPPPGLSVCSVRFKMTDGAKNEFQQVAAFFDGKQALEVLCNVIFYDLSILIDH